MKVLYYSNDSKDAELFRQLFDRRIAACLTYRVGLPNEDAFTIDMQKMNSCGECPYLGDGDGVCSLRRVISDLYKERHAFNLVGLDINKRDGD